MKALFALIVLGTSFSFLLAYKASYVADGLWEDDETAWDGPDSIVFNKKVYPCPDEKGCRCPMLLCTGNKICESNGKNPIKCQLTRPYEEINLQNAKLEFFVKGDCKCNHV